MESSRSNRDVQDTLSQVSRADTGYLARAGAYVENALQHDSRRGHSGRVYRFMAPLRWHCTDLGLGGTMTPNKSQ